MTMRGWPNIFWAIHDGVGPTSAALLVLVLMGVGGTLVLNMVVAFFVQNIKIDSKLAERRTWLRSFPGDLENLTELDLVLWAKRNNKQLNTFLALHEPRVSTRAILKSFYRFFRKPGDLSEQLISEDDDQKDIAFEDVDVSHQHLLLSKNAPEPKQKIRFMVPNCSIFKGIRQLALDPLGPWNMAIFALLLIDLLFFACDSRNASQSVQDAIKIGNAILCVVFALEIIFMLISFGPIRYWNSFFNCSETVLVIIALISIQTNMCPYANIFRLVRIFRSRAVWLNASEYKTGSLIYYFEHWIKIVKESIESLSIHFLMQLTMLFIFSVVSMRIFSLMSTTSISSGYGNINLKTTVFNSTALLNSSAIPAAFVPPVYHLETVWWGKVVSSYSFTNFGVAYVTNFNLGYMNSWYHTMVSYVLQTKVRVFWYFFLWVFIANYVITPVLLARILVIMEKHVVQMVRNQVDRNKELVECLTQYKQKALLFRYMQVLRKNAVEQEMNADPTKVTAVASTNALAKNEVVEGDDDDAPEETWIAKQIAVRQAYTLYLFPHDSAVRRFCTELLTSTKLGYALIAGILASVIVVLGDGKLSTALLIILELYILCVFCFEMGLKWVAHGIVTLPNAYVKDPFNYVDAILNGIVLFTTISQNYVIFPFIIIRIFKIPNVADKLYFSASLRKLAISTRKAALSMFALATLSMFVCFVFAVFGVQLWSRGFWYCKNKTFDNNFEYPPGLSRYTATSSFPTGCSGTSSSGTKLVWRSNSDTFDDIFAACQSIFRVIVMNNWGEIMFNSMSDKGRDYQPQYPYSPSSFVYYAFIGLIATCLNVMFACVIYYHYLFEVLTDGQKIIVNQDQVTWNEMKVINY